MTNKEATNSFRQSICAANVMMKGYVCNVEPS